MDTRHTILIVDDTPENLRVLGDLLEEEYEVRVATDGPGALDTIKSSPPDLILLDILMPGMGGYEVCRELKANPDFRTIPVIFISALDKPQQKIQAFREGAVDYITKPFQAEEVAARVRTHIQLNHLEDLKREIAERKMAVENLCESERKFRTLAESSTDTIMRFDRQHRHLYVNPIVKQQTGMAPESYIGKTHGELGFPKELCDLWEEAIEKTFTTGKVNRAEFLLPSGIWIDWLLAPEVDAQGSVIAVITSARDITDRKRVEKELVAHHQQLLQAEKLAALGRMTAGISHEMNQPLNAMRNYIQEILLNRREGITMSPDEEKNNLEHAISQVDRLAEIIQNMRLFIRDQNQTDFTPISVKAIVKYPLSLLDVQLRSHGIRFDIDSSTPDLTIMGQLNRLQQVMINLVVNAWDAIEQSRLKHAAKDDDQDNLIKLRWRRGDGGAKTAIIEVEDTGIGIAPEDMSRIFEPFFTTKDKEHGTGLGLAICYEIITHHNGSVRIDSKLGQGSLFTIELPLAPEAEK